MFKPGMDETVRDEWRPIGYYPLTPDGLASAVRAAIVRDVNDATEARTIAGLLAEYTAETARLSTAISHALLPQFPRDSDTPVASE
jgi:hypothetical protein